MLLNLSRWLEMKEQRGELGPDFENILMSSEVTADDMYTGKSRGKKNGILGFSLPIMIHGRPDCF
jgi:hypothetical protein